MILHRLYRNIHSKSMEHSKVIQKKVSIPTSSSYFCDLIQLISLRYLRQVFSFVKWSGSL